MSGQPQDGGGTLQAFGPRLYPDCTFDTARAKDRQTAPAEAFRCGRLQRTHSERIGATKAQQIGRSIDLETDPVRRVGDAPPLRIENFDPDIM